MKTWAVLAIAITLTGSAKATVFSETADSGLTVATVVSEPAFDALNVSFTIPRPVILGGGDELDLNVPFATPVALGDYNLTIFPEFTFVPYGALLVAGNAELRSIGPQRISVSGVDIQFLASNVPGGSMPTFAISGNYIVTFDGVPESTTWTLMVLGVCLIGGVARRRSRALAAGA